MAEHVPLGESTINDHETRIEKLENRVFMLEYPAPIEAIPVSAITDDSQPKRPGRPPKNKET